MVAPSPEPGALRLYETMRGEILGDLFAVFAAATPRNDFELQFEIGSLCQLKMMTTIAAGLRAAMRGDLSLADEVDEALAGLSNLVCASLNGCGNAVLVR